MIQQGMIITFILLVLMSPSGFAASLSLQEFLSAADKHDAVIREVKVQTKRVPFVVDAGMPSQKTTIELESQYGFDQRGDDDTRRFGARLSKSFVLSGTDVQASYGISQQPDRRENVTEYRLQQSLYKNAFGKDARLHKQSLTLGQRAQLKSLEDAYEGRVAQLVVMYYGLKKAQFDAQIAMQALKKAKTLRQYVGEKHRQNIATATDVDKADLQVVLYEEDVIAKTRALEHAQASAATASGVSKLHVQDVDSKKILNVLSNSPVFKLHDASLSPMRWKEIIDSRLEQSRLQLEINRGLDAPDVKVFGGISNDKSERFSSKVEQSEVFVGMSLSIPLGDDSSRAIQRLEASRSLELDAELKRQLQVWKVKEKELRLAFEQFAKAWELNQQKVRLSQSIIAAETKRYEIGKVELDRVIALRVDLLRYQFALRASEFEQSQAAVQWLAHTDQLLGALDMRLR